MNGQQTARAEVVRPIARAETIKELVNEAKAGTWDHGVEHVVLRLVNRERYMVKGGRDGIDFFVEGEGEGRTLHMEIDGKRVQIARIYGHTHPRTTGPSDDDLEVLAILRQTHSYLFELGGDRHGTRIGPKPPPGARA